VLVQVSFLYIIYLNQSHLTLFIASLAIPNLVVSLLAMRLLRKNSKKVVIDTNSIEIKKPKLNVFVQGLQVLLFTNVTVPLLIFSTSSSLVLTSQVLIYWRIVSSIGSAMSTMNSLEWRESAIYYSDFSQILNPERKYLIKKILMSLLISVAALMGIVILWDNLSSTPSTFGFITHLFWLFIVPSQVYQWHYYFKLLAAEKYLNLISAGAFQLVTTVLLMYVFDVDNSWRFPASYFFGLLTSGVYLNLRTHFMVRWTRIKNA
jgi:hypothetical protein